MDQIAARLFDARQATAARRSAAKLLTRGEADLRIALLTAKLKLLDEPPHTLWDAVAHFPSKAASIMPCHLRHALDHGAH